MRTLVMLATAVLALGIQARTAAAACDDEGEDPEVCAEQLEAFDEAFAEDVSLVDTVKLAVGDRMLRGIVVPTDDDDGYIESEEDNEFGDDFDDIDGEVDTDPGDVETESVDVETEVDTTVDTDSDTEIDTEDD